MRYLLGGSIVTKLRSSQRKHHVALLFAGGLLLTAEVRIDDYHTYHGWNWVRDQVLSMDKGTVRGLIGAHIFNVAMPTRSGRQIAEFSPDGLNLDEVRKSCDLTAKKPKD
jgi:hypothetical protein